MNPGGAPRAYGSGEEPGRQSANSATVNWLLFACPLTASFSSAFGVVTFAGQAFYPFKIIVPILAIAIGRRTVHLLLRPGSYPFLIATLAVWGFLGLAWSPDRTGGLKEVSILAFAALTASSIALAVRSRDGVCYLIRGWLAAVALTSIVAVWELATGQHLNTPFAEYAGSLSTGFLLSTFANPNNFGAFLVVALPFVSLAASRSGWRWGLNKIDRRIAGVLLVLIPVWIVLSASRLAFIGAIMACLTYMALNHRSRAAWRLGGIMLIGGTGLLIVAADTGQQIISKLSNLSEPSLYTQNSVEVRVNLVLNGLAYFVRTGGIGIGPAGYESSIRSGEALFPVRPGVVNAHNFWIELLSQYGVIGALVMGAILFGATASFLSVARSSNRSIDRVVPTIMLAGLVGYFFASMTASSYINAPENWVFVASFIAMAPVAVALTDTADTADTDTVGAAANKT